MKLTVINIFILLFIISSCELKKEISSDHQHDSSVTALAQQDTIKKSIPKEAHAQVGNAHVMIKYHAPSVRGRTIWGGLVPYEDVWVTGAHSATSLEVDKEFSVKGKSIHAGKYALFTIPRKDQWTIIINKNWDQHLADEYDQKEDVVRLDVTPEQLQHVQERLKYSILSAGDSKGAIEISWEKIKISLPFETK
jgi:hypothetical protein